MESSQNLVKEKAQELHEELRERYPFVFVEIDKVEKYVRECNRNNYEISVDLLYDYLISQGLCEVEE